MLALRTAFVSVIVAVIVAGGCSPELMQVSSAPRLPSYVGPPLGQSTAMGPADSTRPVAVFPGSAPEDIGPGLTISRPIGVPPPTETAPAAQAQPPEGAYSGFLYAPYGPGGPTIPIEQQQPPPPVFQPPPPPDTYQIEGFDEEGFDQGY
jgi:hypothetical protein